ncbi:helix-turn-helix domain-containing protein [Streptomyces jumonjinensis]|uniref:helix-turn-helix domain-containing protein n=1 Tax=Streptomyces jumonjinensis TaxID=1945 RepID=UPI0037BD7023
MVGEAAALYGLAPSTVRWWERQGVLDPPARVGGKRLYDLKAALEYLRHLRLCEDDDIVRHCPVLESELSAHTPRGRVPGADLITAARAARGGGARREGTAARDETPVKHPPGGEKPGGRVPVWCPGCRGPVVPVPRGRPRTYCSAACRQRRYRSRRSGTSVPAPEGSDRS